MFGKKRTNLSVQTIESMAKIYCYALSTHDQKSLNHTGLISSNDIKQMLDNVFEEGDLFNEDDDDDEFLNMSMKRKRILMKHYMLKIESNWDHGFS